MQPKDHLTRGHVLNQFLVDHLTGGVHVNQKKLIREPHHVAVQCQSGNLEKNIDFLLRLIT